MTEVTPMVKFMQAAHNLAASVAESKKIVEVGQVPKGFVAVPREYLSTVELAYTAFVTVVQEIANRKESK